MNKSQTEENNADEFANESQKTRRARRKLQRKLQKTDIDLLPEDLNAQREQIQKWLERRDVERIDLESGDLADPSSEIDDFLDELKKRELGL